MLSIGIGMRFVSVCLPCLGKKDKRCCVGCLETESKIEQDKRVNIELGIEASFDQEGIRPQLMGVRTLCSPLFRTTATC